MLKVLVEKPGNSSRFNRAVEQRIKKQFSPTENQKSYNDSLMTPVLLTFILIIIASLLILGALVWFHFRQREESSRQFQDLARQIIEAQKQDQSMQLLQRELANVRDQM